jgi:hypothetical protein
VDLPGFGFAYATDELRSHWQQLFEVFLERRSAAGSLRRVLLLVDARHGLRQSDHQVMDLMDRFRITFQVVLTKTGRLSLLYVCCVVSGWIGWGGDVTLALVFHFISLPRVYVYVICLSVCICLSFASTDLLVAISLGVCRYSQC